MSAKENRPNVALSLRIMRRVKASSLSKRRASMNAHEGVERNETPLRLPPDLLIWQCSGFGEAWRAIEERAEEIRAEKLATKSSRRRRKRAKSVELKLFSWHRGGVFLDGAPGGLITEKSLLLPRKRIAVSGRSNHSGRGIFSDSRRRVKG